MSGVNCSQPSTTVQRLALLFVVTVAASVGIVTVVFILRASMPEAERSISEFRLAWRGVSR